MGVGEVFAQFGDMYLKSTSSSWDAFPSGKTLEDISLEKVAARVIPALPSCLEVVE